MKKMTFIILVLIQLGALLFTACGRMGPVPPADKTPPKITSSIPTDGYQDFPITGYIMLMFSKEMDPTTLNPQTVVLTDQNGLLQAASVSYATNGTDYVAIVKPSQNLEQDMIYTVSVSETVKDSNGIAMGTSSRIFFITQKLFFVQSSTPAKNAVNVATNSNVNVLFSKTVDPSTLTFNLYSASTGTVCTPTNPCTMDTTNNPNISFKPQPSYQAPQGLLGNTTYTATLSSGVKDFAGDVMTDDYVWSFTTGTIVDVQPPQVQTTDPANGSSNVSAYPLIAITFTEPVRTSPTTTLTLYSAGTGTITCDRTNELATQFFYNLPLSVDHLAYGTPFKATLTAGVQDLAGNPMPAPYSWNFTTALASTQTYVTAPQIAFGVDGIVTVSVAASGTGMTPTGNVSLSFDNQPATQKLLNNGTVSFTISKPNAGNHTLLASYPTQSVFLSSFATGTLTVSGGGSTTTTLQSSPNPSAFGQTVTFIATVTSGATGTVTFKEGATTLGVGTLSGGTPNTASVTTSTLTVGSHSITASYFGDANLPGSTSSPLTQNVSNNSSSTSLQQSSASSAYGASVTFTATVTSSGGIPTGTVTFMDGATTLGTGPLSGGTPNTAIYTTSALGGGLHSITAIYNGSTSYASSQSSPVSHTITNTPTTTTITSSLNPSPSGSSVTFTATVTPTSGGGTPTGQVTFKDGTTTLGTGPLSVGTPNTATFTSSTLAAGSHSVTASYGGDSYFTSTSSPAITQIVNSPFTITPSVNGANGTISPATVQTVNYGSNITFTFTPSTGYFVSNVQVDGGSVGAPTSYTFVNVTANHTISVAFLQGQHIITATAGAGGTINSGGIIVSSGTSQQFLVNDGGNRAFTITPNSGYSITSVLVDGVATALNPYTFTNVTTDHSISATFSINSYALTVNTAGTGSGTVTGAGTYTYGTTATVTAAASGGSTFTGWSGACSGTVSPTTVLVDAAKTCTANFMLNPTLTVSTAGTGSGTVTGAGTYAYNTIAPVSAAASSGSTFTGWSGDCSGTTSPTTVLMNAAKTCTATFTLNSYALTVNTAGTGSGTVTGSGSYAYGATATVTAAASTGSTFTGWSGSCSGTVSPTTVLMDAAKTCTATFTLNNGYTVNTAGTGSGTVTGAGTYTYGTTATVTAAASGGSTFTGWSGACSGAVSPTTVLMDANKTCTAIFTLNGYTLTVNTAGTGSGTVTGAGPYAYNTTATVTAAASSGSTFTGWSGDCSGTVSPTTVQMNANKTCTATFALNSYALTVNTAGTGSGTVTGAGTYAYNTIAPVSAAASSGSTFTGWSGDCSGNTSPTTVLMNAAKTCTATFMLNPTLTVSKAGVGSGTVTGSGTYAYGATATVTAAASTGSTFTGWSGSCSGTASPTTVLMDANKTCTATFAANTYTISVSAGTGGTITPGTVSVNYNASQLFTITPDSGSSIADVVVDGVSLGPVSSYAFTLVSSDHTISASFQ
jgi:predicted small lipoprotein YifL